jgi:selenocysteine lyase/cysteine desulfurase
MLECQRDKFAIPSDVTYLDCAYMSPIPLAAIEAGVAGTAVKAAPWKMTIASYYDGVEEARALAAAMIGATPDDIAICAATSYGIGVAAANVPVPAGSAIVLMENEHTSHRYVWHELAARRGAQIRIVAKPDDGDWTTAIVTFLHACEVPVSVVAGTMIHWFEGTAVDLQVVAEASRAVGACLVVDGTQWVGALPFDVTKVRPDFLSFATYKFLLGPYRMSFLYASERWQNEGQPIEHHSWNRVGGERSDFYLAPVAPFLPGARRFDMGERSDFAVVPVAIESMKLLKGWGITNSFARLAYLNDLIWSEAQSRGLISAPMKHRAPHVSILDFGDRLPADMSARLKKANIHATVRGSKVRVSPHVYNDEGDIYRLLDALSSAIQAAPA